MKKKVFAHCVQYQNHIRREIWYLMIFWLIFPWIKSSFLYSHKLYWVIIEILLHIVFNGNTQPLYRIKIYISIITRNEARLTDKIVTAIWLWFSDAKIVEAKINIEAFVSYKNYHILMAKTTKFLLNVIAVTLSRIQYAIKANIRTSRLQKTYK